MGWELRHGRRYLYHSKRVDGVPRKEYLAASGEWGLIMAIEYGRRLDTAAVERARVREEATAARKRADRLLRRLDAANDELRAAAAVVLAALGFHRHHRGEWRMRRGHTPDAAVQPLLKFQLPKGDAAASFADKDTVDVFGEVIHTYDTVPDAGAAGQRNDRRRKRAVHTDGGSSRHWPPM